MLNPSIEGGYYIAWGWTFNDNESCILFIQHSSEGSVLEVANWILMGINQLIITYQDTDDDTYTITKLNDVSCELSQDGVEFGNATIFLSR